MAVGVGQHSGSGLSSSGWQAAAPAPAGPRAQARHREAFGDGGSKGRGFHERELGAGLSSDYESYGRPWLKAAAVDAPHLRYPLPSAYPDCEAPDRPKYTQGRVPKAPAPYSMFSSAESEVLPSSGDEFNPDVYIRGLGQAPGVVRPGPVAGRQSQSKAKDVRGERTTGPALTKTTARDAELNRSVHSVPRTASLTSEKVRDVVFTDWLAKKATKPKPSAIKADEPKTFFGAKLPAAKNRHTPQATREGATASSKPTPGKKYHRILTPEELFRDSDHVRQAAYEEWMAKKLAESNSKKKTENEAKRQLSASAELEKKLKEAEAQQVFSAWKSQKDEKLGKTKVEQKRAQLEETQGKERGEREKRENAESAFVAWKAPKDERLKKQQLEKKKTQRIMAETKREEEEQKVKSSQSAFDGWKTQKDTKLQEESRRQRKLEAHDRRFRDEMARRKEEQTTQALRCWEERKDAPLKRQLRTQSPVIEARMIWSPPGVGDGGVLRRSLSPA